MSQKCRYACVHKRPRVGFSPPSRAGSILLGVAVEPTSLSFIAGIDHNGRYYCNSNSVKPHVDLDRRRRGSCCAQPARGVGCGFPCRDHRGRCGPWHHYPGHADPDGGCRRRGYGGAAYGALSCSVDRRRCARRFFLVLAWTAIQRPVARRMAIRALADDDGQRRVVFRPLWLIQRRAVPVRAGAKVHSAAGCRHGGHAPTPVCVGQCRLRLCMGATPHLPRPTRRACRLDD